MEKRQKQRKQKKRGKGGANNNDNGSATATATEAATPTAPNAEPEAAIPADANTDVNSMNPPPAPARASPVNFEGKIHYPVLSIQKRTQLNVLVACLWDLTTRNPTTPAEEWKIFEETQPLITNIIKFETILHSPVGDASPAARIANIANFYTWASEHGIHYDGVRIEMLPNYGLGLVATRDIAKDDLLLTVPRHLMLSEEQLDVEVPAIRNMSNLRLTYALLIELMKPDSLWQPYFKLLPDKYNTPFYFSVSDMEQLRGSSALSPVLRQCRIIARQYAFISKQTKEAVRVNAPMSELFNQHFTYDLYCWAVSTVMTRQNMIPNFAAMLEQPELGQECEMISALIPFWDFANHKGGTISSFYEADSHAMAANAMEAVKENEQVFIYYGPRSNAELMLHNGFVDPHNEHDYVNIKLGLNNADPLFEQRVQLLTRLQIARSGELRVLRAPIYISDKLLAFVRIFNMNASELEHWLCSGREHDLLHIDCALDTRLETKTWEYLQIRLMLLLRAFATSLEEDETQLREVRSGERQLKYNLTMILEYRILEKRILTAALDYVKQRAKA